MSMVAPTCPVCGYYGQGDTSKSQITDLFKHQQVAHVDPLKKTDMSDCMGVGVVDVDLKVDPLKDIHDETSRRFAEVVDTYCDANMDPLEVKGMSDTIAATGTFALASCPPPSITIHGGSNTPLVTIHPDGTLTYSPDYTPDAAAKAFWDAMGSHHPSKVKP